MEHVTVATMAGDVMQIDYVKLCIMHLMPIIDTFKGLKSLSVI